MAKTINLYGHNYTVINPNTERARQIVRAWEYSCDVDLDDAYGRYSHAKRNAYEYCREREQECQSYSGRITGHIACTFSYAFMCRVGAKSYLVYITHCNDYAIDVADFE